MNSIIKYPGSKWRIADWIISFFPEHHSYVEPFFGSGAVFFRKERSNIETINDLDGEVVNFFEWVRNDPERLARAIYLTPYSRKVYDNAFRPEENSLVRNCKQQSEWTGSQSELTQAVKFCIRANMGHGFRTAGSKVGWKCDIQGRERAYVLKDWNELPEKIILAAERLKEVQIECRPAVDIIERFNFENCLIYCDPPYLLETRFGKQYKQEMTRGQHEELLDVLLKSKSKVLLSGYDSDLYNDALKGWHKEKIWSAARNSAKKKQEVLWMNFEAVPQMTLWDKEESI